LNPKNRKQHQVPNNELVYKAQVRWKFHSHIKIKIPAFCDEEVFEYLYAILDSVNRDYNSYSEGSYFDLINKHAGNFVDVDNETIAILKQVLHLSEIFGGAFDISVMPLIRLWGFYTNGRRGLPTTNEISEAKMKIDFRKIEIDGNRVRIAKGQEIVTGSFIKAYAVDKLIREMNRWRISDAIINAGGSTIRAVNNNIHPYWRIDVSNPDCKGDNLFGVKLSNACFSTSSQSNTFVEIDSKKYGHILNPLTGYPADNKQTGVITGNCFWGDIISTGLFNVSPGQFAEKMRLLSEQFSASGFLMDKGDKIYFSTNFKESVIT
jgi:thiamine biosynthesis lipoprotein